MKRNLLLLIVICAASPDGWSQDVPVYSQKLTNSFLYNPSVAGNNLGSATLSYRQQWTGATGAPQTTFFSLHTPFARHRMGTGFNVYRETAGVNDNLYASAAYAYHVRITDNNMFSMGASGEYIHSRINYSKVDAQDMDDIFLIENQPPVSRVDFSFGMSYQSRFVKIGASANRISSLVGVLDSSQQFPAFYSGFVNFTIPLVNDRDLLEPVVYLRNLSNGKYQVDAGVYYTMNNRITLGGGYRTGGAASLTGAFRLGKGIYLGYSREVLSGNLGSSLGASNEFTLRFDFSDHRYFTNARNARSINTSALALRRKTLKSYPTRNNPHSYANHNRKFAKKNSVHSPNYRMDSSKKLMTKSYRKPGYKKPAYKRNSNYRRRR
jgi:type IX secretion system PorP/SprF family membrane protein